MKAMLNRLLAGTVAAMLTILSACTVTGVGVDGNVGVDYGYAGGYYEPYGYDYGGWGGAYWVGPSRCCDHRDGRGEGGRGEGGRGDGGRGYAGRGGHAPAYRPAPQGRSAPSIPGRSRGH